MFDVDRAIDSLKASAISMQDVQLDETVRMGAPAAEYMRSPAAYRVAKAAQDSGLFLFHYETRQHLELPEHWVPEHQPELADPPQWVDGVLPERKYQSFRHDQLIGGFHPGHRAKWSTHELCHGLVGFAWTPDATPFFLATAGRLSELLPVVLYYFLDECFLHRCEIHQYGGALFRSHCPACEAVATVDVTDPNVRMRLQDAARYLDQELAAIARSRRLGIPVPHIWGSLDLCSDGLAYARAHGPRLQSDAFRWYMELFNTPSEGWFTELGALEARVADVARHLTVGAPLPAWGGDALRCREQWMRQDIGWRLCTVWEQCDEESGRELMDALVPFADRSAPLDASLARLESAYAALTDAFVLPSWDEVVAVGYELPNGQGVSAEQVLEGVRSAIPVTSTALGTQLPVLVTRFAKEVAPKRQRLATRFHQWLSPQCSGPVRALLAYEAMLVSTGPRDGIADILNGEEVAPNDGLCLAEGVVVQEFDVQPAALLEDVSFGDRTYADGALTDVDGAPVPHYPCGIICFRTREGQVETVEVEPHVAAQLRAGADVSQLDDNLVAALISLGILVPSRWTL
mgnify:CR=1 FL=1